MVRTTLTLNSVERRAAIETGQEVDRQDINLNARANQRVDLLAKAFTLEELEAMKARMLAVMEAEEHGKLIDAPIDPEPTQQPADIASGKQPAKPECAGQTRTPGAAGRELARALPRRRGAGGIRHKVPSFLAYQRAWRAPHGASVARVAGPGNRFR